MKNIEINIGKICNGRCIFCMSGSDSNRTFVGIDKVKSIISRYAEDGYESIGFLGGEITIHPNVIEIVKHCKGLGFKNINFVTNGFRLSDEGFLRELVAAGVTRFNMSVHSHLADTEDFLTGIPGGFNKKIKAIMNIMGLYRNGYIRQPLSINIVLNKANYLFLPNTVLFFNKLGVEDIRINFLWPHKSTHESYGDILIEYSKIFDTIKSLVYISLVKKIKISFDSIPYCILHSIFKDEYLKISRQFMGEKQDSLINEVEDTTTPGSEKKILWRDLRKNSLKIKDDKCSSCKQYDGCEGIWKEYIEQFGFNEFTPIG